MKELSTKAKKKINLEKMAGKELRDSAMKRLVPRVDLCDVTALEGSTQWERQGQRRGLKYVLSFIFFNGTNACRCDHAMSPGVNNTPEGAHH